MEVTIPTCWEDITLEKYINLRPVLQTEQTPIQRVINILCVLTGENREVIKEIKLDNYHRILQKMEFLNTELPKKLKDEYFEIGGKLYTFKFNAKNLLFGEYISAMEMIQEAADNEEKMFTNLPKLLTTICRPVKKVNKKYKDIEMDGELVRQTADNFYKNMPITIAYPIGVFFYNHLPTLTEDIKISLIKKATQNLKEAATHLENVGDGGV